MTDSPRKVLVSACLLGNEVRYDATGATAIATVLRRWHDDGRLVLVCPEVAGGLPVPRPAAEQQPDGRVVTRHDVDVTQAFEDGAARAVELARRYDVAFAVLKARSPSCGANRVYDGTFSGRLKDGSGVTTSALRSAGYQVFSDEELDRAVAFLAEIEADSGARVARDE